MTSRNNLAPSDFAPLACNGDCRLLFGEKAREDQGLSRPQAINNQMAVDFTYMKKGPIVAALSGVSALALIMVAAIVEKTV